MSIVSRRAISVWQANYKSCLCPIDFRGSVALREPGVSVQEADPKLVD
jgi:hypothetical protein